MPIAIYVLIASFISFIALPLIKERSLQDVSIEYDELDRTGVPRAISPV